MRIRKSCSRSGERDLFHQGKLFLELARDDQWRANILIQLAESVGDQVGALSGYIDMLLAARPGEKYLGWFTELGRLERGGPGAGARGSRPR